MMERVPLTQRMKKGSPFALLIYECVMINECVQL